ncbi:hypothetical protein IFT48_15885 [Pseudomonas fluorescens]|uniref:hypothetical protein n=1 Tax=Pseudomonas fluorescens TaxID=294 RepID=UPI001906CBF5|nr:hypothetical protein [Pseudomonas fluorescens]MBD8091477.1 hypothetical protein [Pseudomonas fluorescens]MBD8716905.1 hypothetical protein [Pseudomonas fluorescens]
MNEHHLSLPDKIQAALKIHDENKKAYLSIRERFAGLRAREEKHRKTASAAEQQAMLDGSTWRKLFRESDGVLTKDIRNFKRQELDSRELALEYACLAGELQPEMEVSQIDTYEARERYLSSRETAFALYGDHCLTTSATSLFALPEAKAFLKALQRKKLIIQRDIEKDAFYQEATFNDDQLAVSSEQARRLGEVLFGFIDRASAALSVDDNTVWQALSIVPRDDFTTGEKELKSPIYRARRRSELNAMIEQHTETQTS